MKLTQVQVRNYLNRLGVSVADGDAVDLREILPLNVAGRYDATRTAIAGERCVMLFPRSESIHPDEIVSDSRAIGGMLDGRPVLAFSRLDREFAGRLKSAHVSYVVPSRQAYIPPSIVLESDRAYAEDEIPLGAHLSPWAQVVLVDCLLHERMPGTVPFSSLRGRLGASPVNLSRATRELERRGLARTVRQGRDGGIEFSFDKRRLWGKASSVFASPVRSRIRTKVRIRNALDAGITALAGCSDIVDDEFPTVAIPSSEARKIPASQTLRYGGNVVESWRYDPRLLNDGRTSVDPLSLCLSLRESSDPRIQIATEKLLEETLW